MTGLAADVLALAPALQRLLDRHAHWQVSLASARHPPRARTRPRKPTHSRALHPKLRPSTLSPEPRKAAHSRARPRRRRRWR